MEKIPIENWNSARIHTAQAMIRSMEAEMRLLEKQRDVMSVCKSDKVRSLEMQVQQLEKQRDFLSLWKPDLHNGLHMQDTHVDVQLQASDGSCIYAHKAVLVCFLNILFSPLPLFFAAALFWFYLFLHIPSLCTAQITEHLSMCFSLIPLFLISYYLKRTMGMKRNFWHIFFLLQTGFPWVVDSILWWSHFGLLNPVGGLLGLLHLPLN